MRRGTAQERERGDARTGRHAACNRESEVYACDDMVAEPNECRASWCECEQGTGAVRYDYNKNECPKQ